MKLGAAVLLLVLCGCVSAAPANTVANDSAYYAYAHGVYEKQCNVANPVSDCAYFYEDLKQVKFWLADADKKVKAGKDAKDSLASLKIAVNALKAYAPETGAP